jgi:toxin CcdB
MAQFTVYRNPAASKKKYPLLLDIQSAFAERLATRVVVPLARPASLPYDPITRLMPRLEILGETYVAITQELAGVPRAALGKPVAELAHKRGAIVAALDLLLTGG